MKVTVINRLNKRNFPTTEGNVPLANPLLPGDIIDVVEEVRGTYHGNPPNDIWYKTSNGYYVWSGGTRQNHESILAPRVRESQKSDSTPGVLKPYNPADYWWIKDYGIDKIWEMGITGRGVKVAVLDEGLDLPHPDLPNLIDEHFVDITKNGQQRLDRNSHGTHVFGIMAASNNGFGVTGLCFNSEFFFAKIHHFQNAYEHKYLISAINWAIDKKVDIITISQGSYRKLDEIDLRQLNDCLDRAVIAKTAIFCAAGNDGGTAMKRIPAKISTEKRIFSIGHINQHKMPTETTVLDSRVSIFAPGFKITSTGRKASKLYFEDSGSSMATPFVAGIASLIIEAQRKNNPSFSALDAADLIFSTAKNTNFGKIVNPLKIFDK